MEITSAAVDDLAHGVAVDGVEAHWAAVVALVDRARAGGCHPSALDVLADPTAPAVARQRSFGRVLGDLARCDLDPSPAVVPQGVGVPAAAGHPRT